MLGSGVGYNIQREYVEKLPNVVQEWNRPSRKVTVDADFIVPDSREGWVRLLAVVLDGAFGGGSLPPGFTYSTICVRGKGSAIKGFGGVASGPEELCDGIGEIGRILESRRGEKLRPIDCLDIMNIIGQIVVSGNVRRSAQIAIGDYDDKDFLRAKRWDLGPIPRWRSNSNNSVVCGDIRSLPEEFWEGYRGNGEPYGLINLGLAQSCGRLGEYQYPDPLVRGFNPCAEQGLADRETCCLAEIFLPNVGSFEELNDIARLLYRVCKHSLTLPCHHRDTEAAVQRNFRMGLGITGYLQATEEQRSWLSAAYEAIREYDTWYSKKENLPPSIKLTTVKPSGTLSLLPGVTPGCHPAFATYLIRRIQFASNSKLVDVVSSAGYQIEYRRNFDGTIDPTTVVASFPFAYPPGTKVASETTAIDQLEVVRRLQREWSDNAVSCTVYFRDEELPEIQAYLRDNYSDNFKSLSFLRHANSGFDQLPLEEITREEYEQLVASSKLITSVDGSFDFDYSDGCESTGVCPIK